MPDHLIVGLGNPGPKYDGTRHNIGFDVIDDLASTHGGRWANRADMFECALDIQGNKTYLLKPLRYMNLSGEVVGPYARFYKLDPSNIVVIHDEVDLPVGSLVLKQGGGDAGHNGLRSVTACLGSSDYVRVRLGIGRPVHGEVHNWVLHRFDKDEQEIVAAMKNRACAGIEELLRAGLKSAQNKFNLRIAQSPGS